MYEKGTQVVIHSKGSEDSHLGAVIVWDVSKDLYLVTTLSQPDNEFYVSEDQISLKD